MRGPDIMFSFPECCSKPESVGATFEHIRTSVYVNISECWQIHITAEDLNKSLQETADIVSSSNGQPMTMTYLPVWRHLLSFLSYGCSSFFCIIIQPALPLKQITCKSYSVYTNLIFTTWIHFNLISTVKVPPILEIQLIAINSISWFVKSYPVFTGWQAETCVLPKTSYCSRII